MTTPAWIGLGSNLGDRRAILDSALADLAQVDGVTLRAVSSYRETQPVGGPPGQGPFLNAAARLDTTLGPHQLLESLQTIEARAGRVRVVRWGERTLDLDILIFGTKFLDEPDLKLPHPRLALRRFVLGPLAEIAPDVVDTMTRRTIAGLLANLDRTPRLLAIHGPEGDRKSAVFHRLVDELPGFGVAADPPGRSADRDDDPYSDRFHASIRDFDALRAGSWEAENLRVPWIVADYFPRLNLMATHPRALLRPGLHPDRDESMRDFREARARLQAAEAAALAPTLAVILPGDHGLSRRPGLATVPLLWPDSDDPDAIVAEVLATCRGIAGA